MLSPLPLLRTVSVNLFGVRVALALTLQTLGLCQVGVFNQSSDGDETLLLAKMSLDDAAGLQEAAPPGKTAAFYP